MTGCCTAIVFVTRDAIVGFIHTTLKRRHWTLRRFYIGHLLVLVDPICTDYRGRAPPYNHRFHPSPPASTPAPHCAGFPGFHPQSVQQAGCTVPEAQQYLELASLKRVDARQAN
jgi:hypothetical protein